MSDDLVLTGTWIHVKTGNKYVVDRVGLINATNAQNGQRMVMYRRYGHLRVDEWFVREAQEFLLKFEFDGEEG